MTDQLLRQLDRDGFAIVPDLLDDQQCNALLDAVEMITAHAAVRERSGSTYAVRRLCELVPQVARLAESKAIRSFIEPVLGLGARVVRSLLFDKTADANWKVPWHQDVTIAVRRQVEVSGFGPWSMKAGVPHVQPPGAVLEQMLTIRLHLDDCGTENGALRVLPGSHRMGLIDPGTVGQVRERIAEETCAVKRGGAMLMRPLLLHASSAAVSPAHRRVIHLEYAGIDLPGGLEWQAG